MEADIEKYIQDIKYKFYGSNLDLQRKKSFSVSEIVGAISLAFHRGIQVGKEGHKINNPTIINNPSPPINSK